VGITRARKRLHLSLAMTRAQFGEVSVAMPSRFLQEIPAELIDWRQSPGDINGRGALRQGGGFGGGSTGGGGGGWRSRHERFGVKPHPRRESTLKPKSTAMDRFANTVTGKRRDNGDMELASGDRINHDDFGEGRVEQVTGEGAKRIAHVQFDTAGRKKLL